ncbi:MAG: hypothetical protein Q4G46_09190 [Propionibacteriaceae bacterium]|nr:hypothetical protein [Propionibacteriaceae bacterium]
MSKNSQLFFLALIFSFALRVIREWVTHDRTLIDTFSRWEWGVNFLLYWGLSFLAIWLVFIGLHKLWSDGDSHSRPRKG